MATHKWVRTAFSEYPHKVFTTMFCFTHLKKLWEASHKFFKWRKQHLKIKKFWGASENAVRIQIYCAICAYCLVAIAQHDLKLEISTYETLQILGISLTDTTPLEELLSKTNLQNVKDQDPPNGQLFINF